ncbi:tRNA-binding protein [Pelagirhabdus alkalitolerans]|uniref:tRNA-binding protein n=1 Tax=Pelagirhabdus alkalitolerans TaxID=1612202 RepID=A0A1G6HIQ2_9BACI|nr:DUF4479 family protein [Pelagirhabdus alkalitolerans]SDB93978.1 tRNA-binding protein [Pelagirhabdus alkalitolerans]
MDVFYNRNGIGDVLVIPIKTGNRDDIKSDQFGDVTVIRDTESEEVLGYNLFKASTYLDLSDGKHQITESFLEKINDVFKSNGVDHSLDLDLSPKFVVGYVQSVEQHENADKLKCTQVDLGDEVTQIVCGAPNIAEGQHVVVAKVGAIMPSGMEIKATNLRGVDSFGMICSQKELGLPNAPEEKGIYVLDENRKAGEVFEF